MILGRMKCQKRCLLSSYIIFHSTKLTTFRFSQCRWHGEMVTVCLFGEIKRNGRKLCIMTSQAPVYTAFCNEMSTETHLWINLTFEFCILLHRVIYLCSCAVNATMLFDFTITLHVSTTSGHPQVSQFTHTSTKLQRLHLCTCISQVLTVL
jgi:hypothetical protein